MNWSSEFPLATVFPSLLEDGSILPRAEQGEKIASLPNLKLCNVAGVKEICNSSSSR